MSHLDKQKNEIINQIRNFCRHCSSGEIHVCPVSRIISEIKDIRGIPIIVNDQLHHVMFQ